PSDRAAAGLIGEACADIGLPLATSVSRTLAEQALAQRFLDLLPSDGVVTIEACVASARETLERCGLFETGLVPSGPIEAMDLAALSNAARTRTGLDGILESYLDAVRLLRRSERPWPAHVAALRTL